MLSGIEIFNFFVSDHLKITVTIVSPIVTLGDKAFSLKVIKNRK